MPAIPTVSLRSILARTGRVSLVLAPLAALASGCVATPLDESTAGVATSALCPAPGASMTFDAPLSLFQSSTSQQYQPAHTVAGDFDGDGWTDALTIDGRDNRLFFFAGDGAGITLSGVQTLGAPSLTNTHNPQGAATLDFEGDGDLDVAYVIQGGSTLVVAVNDGQGSFSVGATRVLTGLYGLKRVATGDFDEDGRPDMAVTSNVNNKVQVVLNTIGGLVLPPAIALPSGGAPFDIAASDLNLDGHLDLVVGNALGPSPFVLYQGAGNATFTLAASPAPKDQGNNGASTYGLVVRDMDADGKPDVAYLQSSTHAVHLFRNTSTASVSFASEAQSGTGPIVLSDNLNSIYMDGGDLDADGRVDLAVIGNVPTVGTRLHVLANTGAAGAPLSFASAGSWLVNAGGKTSTSPRGFVVAPYDVQTCGARADVVFASNNGSVGDFSVQYVHNTTE